MNKTELNENWFSRAKAEADKGIPSNERFVGVGIVVFVSLLGVYYISHQIGSTGFFTEKFGAIEMIMLYGSLIFMIISASLEGILGQRLLSRLWDAFGGLVFATIAEIWLLMIFPFEFTYFADVLPDFLRFLAQWISNDIARILMIIIIIVTLGAAIYTPIAYKFVRIKRSKPDQN